MFLHSKTRQLDCRDLVRLSSEEPIDVPPLAPRGITWTPQEQPQANCQIAFLAPKERDALAAKLLNKCNVCGARISSYCSPRCFLEPDGAMQSRFYCINGNGGRNCFNERHVNDQPTNRIPIRGIVGRCTKCSVGLSRFYCNKCNKRYCLLNNKECFYSPEHAENCVAYTM